MLVAALLLAPPVAAQVGFTTPEGWTLTSKGAVTLVAPPEPDTRIAIVEVGAAADATDAAAKAWALYRPEAKRKMLVATPGAAKDGWDERVSLAYETAPNERAVVAALALRKGAAWTVMIADGSEPTFEKRGAAASLIQSSLRPAGYVKESFAGKTANRMTPERVKALTDFVAQGMAELGVPGAGIAVIENGRVIYAGGLGVRELGKPGPVTADTRFMIASNTKGMSTLLLSMLADQGRLRWDQPVTQLYPAFRLGDDRTTKAVLVQHLVCACTGLPRKDMEWILNTRRDTPASDTFKQLAATQPTSGFGELFQYNNLMASAAGYVGGMLAFPRLEMGVAYDRAMQARIFRPLGMTATGFSMAQALAAEHAAPHGTGLDGKVAVLPQDFNYSIHPARPAGAAWSTARDMANYVRLELSKGLLPDGRRLVSEANLLKRRARGVSAGEGRWYGMGLQEDVVADVSLIHHGGSMFGYKSDWVAIPAANVGAVLLMNGEEGRPLLRPFMRRLLEILYDGRPEAAADVRAAAAAFKAQLAAERARWTVPAAPEHLALLASAYDSPELGRLSISRNGAEASATFVTGRAGRLASRRNDDGSISFATYDPVILGLELVAAGSSGKPDLILRDAQHEYRFRPAP
ncbi:beta-lactamase family protein [Sandaracinobacteroides saxicola]|uniref:Beta-lactamase family protein n=2 Tax=Sandaracinobacteroides saxicola TaxID=2759707 RepID=A0A7G5IMG5_9SPHN|nr:beta-lactamase family protein [Sandaracinobacteroides saxicola]